MAAGADPGLTFGELAEQAGVGARVSAVTREVIRRSNAAAAERARVHLYVVSCDTCTAAKACCRLVTTAYLPEAIPIAARLIRERRDTPALRDQLREAAAEMERARPQDYRHPCVFLDAAERCTVYEDRPSICGTHLVSSPAARCAQPEAEVTKLVAPLQEVVPPRFAARVAEQLGLEEIGVDYVGVLPRMVLLCLEAWPRHDYAGYLAEHWRAVAKRREAGPAAGSTRAVPEGQET